MSAETIPPRWYCVSNYGRATLCANEADALAEVERDTADWPLHAPYRAVRLVDASAVADDRELLKTALRALVWETGSDGIMAAQTDKVIKALRVRLLRAERTELSGPQGPVQRPVRPGAEARRLPTPEDLRSYADDADQHGNHWAPITPASLRGMADEFERLNGQRRKLQTEAEELKARCASSRLDLMRELIKQGWAAPKA